MRATPATTHSISLSEIDNHTLEKRSIFGLSAFVSTLLSTIFAISLNTSVNTQNADHGGIVG